VIDSSLWSPSFSGEPIVSFSQNAEDVRLWRVFRTIENGFYVDIGAALPDVDSVTRLFYDHGWSGINVEPSPSFDALSEARTRDVNLRVAVGETEGSVPFFLTYPYLGLSTVDPATHQTLPEAIDRIEEVTIPQRRLESILREFAPDRTIHFLKVDVEGGESQVLASSDWHSFQPIVVIVEAVKSWSTSPTHQNWQAVLLDAGYRHAAFDGINRFYVAEGHDYLVPILAYPICAIDRFVMASTRDLHVALDEAHQALRDKARECERLRQSLERGQMELIEAKHVLDELYDARNRRAGRRFAAATTTVQTVRKHLREVWFR
jgi:FkbM family methyltransferase